MVNLNIGQKIQKYRTQRGLSLRRLAEKTGITASMISQIENNAVNPSINTLKTLAETLDFPLYVLFQEDSDPEQELIVRKGEYRSIGNRNSEVAYNLLTADTKASIEFVLMEIPPQTVTSDKDRSHVGEETAYVEEGDVTISSTVNSLSCTQAMPSVSRPGQAIAGSIPVTKWSGSSLR